MMADCNLACMTSLDRLERSTCNDIDLKTLLEYPISQSIDPSVDAWIREQVTSYLGEDGENVSGVLARLCDDVEEKKSFVNWVY